MSANPAALDEAFDGVHRSPATAMSGGPGLGRVLRIAWRDLRGQARGFLVFVLCIALGVAAIAGVGALRDAIRSGLADQGRVLLGGDIEITRIHQRADKKQLEELGAQGRLSEIASMRAMVLRPSTGESFDSVLVELKAVDAAYPLLGELATHPDGATRAALGNDLTAIVAPELLARLDVEIGDKIQLGEIDLTIAGTLRDEPDKFAGRAIFGPRVFVSLATFEASGLVQPGALMRWRYRIAVDDNATLSGNFDEGVSDLEERFASQGFQIRDRRNPQPSVRKALDRLAQFLTLVGLTAMLVGGVGVANSVASYLDRKRKVIATFKSLGAQNRTVFSIYLAEVLFLALVGIAGGLALGFLAPIVLVQFLGDQVPIELTPTMGFETLLMAIGYGLLVALVFVLWPLGRAEKIQPALLFRDTLEETGRWPRLAFIAATLVCLVLLAAFAVLTSDDWWTATIFLAGLAGIFAVFSILGWLVAKGAARMRRPRQPELALAIGNLSGPGALTRSVILSLGVGLSLLVTVALVDRAMVSELEGGLPDDAPNYFFLDVAKDDLTEFRSLVGKVAPGAFVSDAPMLRGRIVELAGKAPADVKADPDAAWVLEGDRGLTYADTLPENSRVTSGEWWPKDYDGPPLVSFADELANGLGLKVGDTVTVNVLGRNITAKVANLRTVKWESLAINFVMIFSPNTLSAAPFKIAGDGALPGTPRPQATRRAREVSGRSLSRRDRPQRPGCHRHLSGCLFQGDRCDPFGRQPHAHHGRHRACGRPGDRPASSHLSGRYPESRGRHTGAHHKGQRPGVPHPGERDRGHCRRDRVGGRLCHHGLPCRCAVRLFARRSGSGARPCGAAGTGLRRSRDLARAAGPDGPDIAGRELNLAHSKSLA